MDTADKIFNQAIELLKKEDYAKSLELLNGLVLKHPQRADFISERGVVYFHLKNKKAALADLDKALEIEPNKPYRYSSRAYVLGHYGLLERAIADYERAIELDAEDAIAVNNLGLLQDQLGYRNKAKSNFEKADALLGIDTNRGRKDLGYVGEDIPARNIQEEIDAEQANSSIKKELLQVFTKSGFRSFTRFISEGFQLKNKS